MLRELCGRRIIAILLCGRGTFACSVERDALQAGRRHVMAPPPLSITQASRRRHAPRLATVDPHEHGTVWPLRPVDRPAQAPGDLVTLQENSSPSTPPPTATGALITSGNRPPLLRHLQPHDATLPLSPPHPHPPSRPTRRQHQPHRPTGGAPVMNNNSGDTTKNVVRKLHPPLVGRQCVLPRPLA